MGAVSNLLSGPLALAKFAPADIPPAGTTGFELTLSQVTGANGTTHDDAMFTAFTYGAHSETVTFGSGSGSSMQGALSSLLTPADLTAVQGVTSSGSGASMLAFEKAVSGDGTSSGSGSLFGQIETFFNDNPGKNMSMSIGGVALGGSGDTAEGIALGTAGGGCDTSSGSGSGLSGQMRMAEYMLAAIAQGMQLELQSAGSQSGGNTSTTG